MQRTIGIIAGSGVYPEEFINAAREKSAGARLVMAAAKNETRPELADIVDSVIWFRVGQLNKVIKFFQKEKAKDVVMVGQIAPKNLFDMIPDMRVVKILSRTKKKNAESLFGAIADEFQKEGITILPATTFLEDIMPSAGKVCGPKLSKSAQEDAQYGFCIAKEISRLDIGQSVLVRNGTVLAVEGFEGTNSCIKRAGELGKGKDITLAKVSKPNQDFRFDVPVIGPDTIKNCAQAGVKTIAIEAERTILLEGQLVSDLASENKISLVALN